MNQDRLDELLAKKLENPKPPEEVLSALKRIFEANEGRPAKTRFTHNDTIAYLDEEYGFNTSKHALNKIARECFGRKSFTCAR